MIHFLRFSGHQSTPGVICMCLLLLLSSCTQPDSEGENSNGPNPTPEAKKAPNCPELFPGSQDYTFNAVLAHEQNPPDLAFDFSPDCPFELGEYAKDCKCSCTLQRVVFSDLIPSDGTTFDLVFNHAGTGNTPQTFTVQDGSIDLSSMPSLPVVAEGTQIVFVGGGIDPARTKVNCPGLCVVLDIEGGGI